MRTNKGLFPRKMRFWGVIVWKHNPIYLTCYVPHPITLIRHGVGLLGVGKPKEGAYKLIHLGGRFENDK